MNTESGKEKQLREGVEGAAVSSERKIPAAKIQFLPEDRAWIAARIEEVLESGQLTLGKFGAAFEEKFADFCGSRHAIAVNSGTSAIEIALRALDVAGRDVIVPTNTFFATAAAVVHAGGNLIFADMDPTSFGVSPETIEAALTPNTAGIVVVHIGGIVSSRMPEIQEMAARRGLWIVEDAAHAHGSSFRGKQAGTFGVAGTFSFYPTKVMTSAEGGMIVTDDDRIAEEARIYRDQGKASFTQNAHIRLGYNWRMSEPHAIIGLKHLERLPQMIADRQWIASFYDQGLSQMRNLSAVRVAPDCVSNYYKYMAVLRETRERKALKAELRERFGVSLSGEVYEEPLHLQPVFARYSRGPLSISEDYCSRQICLPVYSGMDASEAEQVLHAVQAVIG